MIEKLHGNFTTVATPLPQLSPSPEDGHAYSQSGTLVSGSGRSRAELICKELCLCVLTCVGLTERQTGSTCFCFTSELRLEKQQADLKSF